jgi:transcriptional regulator with XRE-family HTH domain
MEETTGKYLPMSKFLKERDVTQQQLADAAGVSLRAVQSWLSGEHRPRLYLDKTVEVCELLGLPLESLADLFKPEKTETP